MTPLQLTPNYRTVPSESNVPIVDAAMLFPRNERLRQRVTALFELELILRSTRPTYPRMLLERAALTPARQDIEAKLFKGHIDGLITGLILLHAVDRENHGESWSLADIQNWM